LWKTPDSIRGPLIDNTVGQENVGILARTIARNEATEDDDAGCRD